MTTFFSTALVGFFAMSNVAGIAPATTTVQKLIEEPTYITHTVSMTAYNAVPEQTDGDPHITASGVYSDPDVVAARSVDLADELPFGTVVEISYKGANTPNCGFSLVEGQIGLRVIADSMHPRKRNQIDVLFDHEREVKVGGKYTNPARALGICKDVVVKVVGHVDIKRMPRTQAELAAALDTAHLALATK